MKTKIAILIVVFLFLLGGCAPVMFRHPTKSSEDFEKDKYECDIIATQHVRQSGFGGNPLTIRDEIIRCLTLKFGWVRSQ